MLWENCWIIMTINYVTDWSVTKAVLNAMKATVVDFLYDEIFINYDSSRELLFNNDMNFLSYVVTYYLKKLRTYWKKVDTHTILCCLVKLLNYVVYGHILIKRVTEEVERMLTVVNVNRVFT